MKNVRNVNVTTINMLEKDIQENTEFGNNFSAWHQSHKNGRNNKLGFLKINDFYAWKEMTVKRKGETANLDL